MNSAFHPSSPHIHESLLERIRCLSLTGSTNFGVILDNVALGREYHQSCGTSTGLKVKHSTIALAQKMPRCLASNAIWQSVNLTDKDTI